MEAWPHDLARIVVDRYGLTYGDNTRRTLMQDGAVDQRRIAEAPPKLRTFDVLVRDSALADFQAWVRKVGGDTWFLLRDLDDNTERRVRILGGRIPLTRQRDRLHADRLPPERYWRGSVTLEGPAA